ncbi:testis-expressed protein 2 [Lingula anatina]|uniref:Testis-expressed protein 2 n=1 Tax=Lingula anatina TaxID=7574 RepID=A0A1S3HFV8_LINAN|nr:testis-expressed protein 2 [Lingula anatina]|eukprot:XP_013384366.1 testis-expressed protein 2 [Lingula anatina]
MKMSMKKEAPPPRPPAPSLGKLSKGSPGGIAIRFNATNLESDSDIEDDLKDSIQFHRSESSGGLTTWKRSNDITDDNGNNKEDMISPCSLQKPSSVSDLETVKQKDHQIHRPGWQSDPLGASPTRTRSPKMVPKRPKPPSTGIRKIATGVIEDDKDGESWFDSKDSPDDPLTALSKKLASEAEEDDLSDYSSDPKINDEVAKRKCAEDNGSVPPAESIKIMDEYYEAEPLEEFDGGVNLPRAVITRSSAGVEVSQAMAVGGSSKAKKIVRKAASLLKNRPKPTMAPGPLTFSSLMDKKSKQDSEDTFYDIFESTPPVDSKASPKDLQNSAQADHHESVPGKKLFSWMVIVFLYFILPLPSYISGMVIGAAIMYALMRFYKWWMEPRQPMEPCVIPPLSELPPLLVPEMKEGKNDGVFKGWMNELQYPYDPEDYHISQTFSIYVRLEGSTLRLSRPLKNVPKRAMWDEPHHTSKFIHQRIYDLTDSRVFLLPQGLVKKRVWSKKYPLCIKLSKAGDALSKQMSPQSSTEDPYDAKGSGFEVVTKEACDDSVLYLFARSGREKEEWYWRFDAATKGTPLSDYKLEQLLKEAKFLHKRSSSYSSLKSHKREGSTDSTKSWSSEEDGEEPLRRILLGYAGYMGRIMPKEDELRKLSGSSSNNSLGMENDKKPAPGSPGKKSIELNAPGKHIACEPQVLWVNALIGRLFWDFLREKYWADKCAEKIQKKLDKIHVPYFIDALVISDIELGTEMPVIRRASKPYLDERGLWIDLDIAYNGDFRMTLETKVNLMKLKKKKHVNKEADEGRQRKKSAITDEDEEDSAESSTDEEDEETFVDPSVDQSPKHSQGQTKGRKLLAFLDKITESKYFQQATEYKYIKKAMEGVSNTPLILTVELKSLVGTLSVNIPPPPTDRLWYGFRTNPRLWLTAKPRVGEREVSYTHVTEWIEKKLALEFQRVFVLPNMDDLVIPLMVAGYIRDSMTAQAEEKK